MDIHYTNQTIKLTIESVDFTVLRILAGNCDPLVPSHSHSACCYEIHYITAGLGRALMLSADQAEDRSSFFRLPPQPSYG